MGNQWYGHMGRRSLTLPNYIFRCRIGSNASNIFRFGRVHKICVQPYFFASNLTCLVSVYCWVVSDFVSELLPHPRQNFRLPGPCCCLSLNPARSLAAAQVASTGYSILDTLPLSPFTVRNSVAITPSALSLRSQVMMANSKKCHQKLCKLSLTVSGGESVTWKFLMQHIFSHHTKIDKIKESQGSTHT